MADPSPAAFLSYVHSDDDHDNGRISKLRERLEGEVRMHTGRPFHIFQDRNDLEWGQNWQERIESSIKKVTFLIPIVTPSYFNSPACRREYELFLEREATLGTNQLVMPIYYLSSDQMEDGSDDLIGISLRSRQYRDWRPLRFLVFEDPTVSKNFADLAEAIKNRTRDLISIIEASKREIVTDAAPKGTSKIQSLSKKPGAELKTLAERRLLAWLESHDTVTPIKIETPPDIGEPYKVYTAEFDEVIRAEDFLPGKDAVGLTKISTQVASDIQTQHAAALTKFSRDLEKFRAERTAAVTILLDNSGSLRGRPISYVTAWTIILVELFEDAGFKTEVIGFTTRGWKGGQSREKWLSDGRPAYPGRLNDIRYLIYKDFSQGFVETIQNYGVMLRDAILKENIDGEALLFARDRLDKQQADIKSLIVVSDGAPVDDSTLSVNGSTYLERHLTQVIEETTAKMPNLMAVGVDTDPSRYYGERGIKSKADRWGISLINLLRRRLGMSVPAKRQRKSPS